MEAVESYKIFGLLSIFLSWAAGGYLVYKWRGNKGMSLSLHAASFHSAYFLFAITLTIIGFLFSLFAINYFIPTFQLPHNFTVVLFITLGCQFITAWTPDRGTLPRKIHRITAYSLAAFLPVLLFFVCTSPKVSLVAQVISAIVIGFMCLCWYLFIFVKSFRTQYLIYQSFYVIGFHLTILAATYL